MGHLADVNVLLAICDGVHEHHVPAGQWLSFQERRSVALCRLTQLGLLRLLTNPVVMTQAVCTLRQAWSTLDQLLSDERFVFHSEPGALEGTFRSLTAADTVSTRLWQDAYLAAFAMASGLGIVTFDSGFRQFSDLGLILLR